MAADALLSTLAPAATAPRPIVPQPAAQDRDPADRFGRRLADRSRPTHRAEPERGVARRPESPDAAPPRRLDRPERTPPNAGAAKSESEVVPGEKSSPDTGEAQDAAVSTPVARLDRPVGSEGESAAEPAETSSDPAVAAISPVVPVVAESAFFEAGLEGTPAVPWIETLTAQPPAESPETPHFRETTSYSAPTAPASFPATVIEAGTTVGPTLVEAVSSQPAVPPAGFGELLAAVEPETGGLSPAGDVAVTATVSPTVIPSEVPVETVAFAAPVPEDGDPVATIPPLGNDAAAVPADIEGRPPGLTTESDVPAEAIVDAPPTADAASDGSTVAPTTAVSEQGAVPVSETTTPRQEGGTPDEQIAAIQVEPSLGSETSADVSEPPVVTATKSDARDATARTASVERIRPTVATEADGVTAAGASDGSQADIDAATPAISTASAEPPIDEASTLRAEKGTAPRAEVVRGDSPVLRTDEGLPAAPPPPAQVGLTTRSHALDAPGRSSVVVPDDLPDHAAAALRAAASLDRPIRIRLTPPELGTLRVEVSRQEGGVAARFEVTTAAAQSTLAEHLSSLRESLGRAGLPVERIEIRLAEPRPDDGRSDERHGGERQESQQHGGQRRDDGERRRESAGRPSAESDSDFNERPTDDEPSGAASRRSDADLLDIQV